ncbi:MAG TPA: OmpA family protein [Methylomirabilota bacterium]|jgi:outer membrane protein OmpA-like peptidoglycan-associated protein
MRPHRRRQGAGPPTNVRRLAWFLILPALGLAVPILAGFRTQEVTAVGPAPDAVSTVYFAAGTTQIRPGDRRILDAHAAWLRGVEKRVLLIEGHTDSPGDSVFSRDVGEQRAKAARAYLVSRGAGADRITTGSRSGGQPSCEEKTPTCRALNRRATISAGELP